MIHHVASANILPGKEKEAEQWLLKVAAFVNQKFPGTNSHILRNFDGKGNLSLTSAIKTGGNICSPQSQD